MKPIIKKELQTYFYNPLGYVFMGITLTLSGWLFWNDLFVMGNIDIKPLLQTIAYLLSLFVPAITMGWLAEEKKGGYWEVLMSTPINVSKVLWGKLVAGAMLLATTLALTIPGVLTLRYLGRLDYGALFTSYLGVWLLGVSYMSIGLFVSGITKNQAVAFVVTSVVLVLNSLMGQDIVLARLPSGLVEIVSSLSLGDRINSFYSGQISAGSIIFLISVIVLFTWWTEQIHEKHK